MLSDPDRAFLVETAGSPTASLGWRHERLHRRVLRDPAALLPLLAARSGIEARWLEVPPDPHDAFDEADRHLAAWLAAAEGRPVVDRRPLWARRYWRTRDRRVRLPWRVGVTKITR